MTGKWTEKKELRQYHKIRKWGLKLIRCARLRKRGDMKSSRLVTRYGPLCLVPCTGHRGYSLDAELWRSSVCKGMVGEVNLGSVTVTLQHCRHPRGNVKQATCADGTKCPIDISVRN